MATNTPKPPRSSAPPPLEYILELVSELEREYSEQDAQIDRMRELREQRRKVNLPKEYQIVDVEVRDPTITDEVQRTAAMLSVNPDKLTVRPSSEGDKGQKNATLREHWTEEVFRLIGTRAKGQDTPSAVKDSVVGDGGGWTKLVYSRDLWEERYRLRTASFEDDGDDVPEAERRSRSRKFNDATEEAKRRAGPPFVWVCPDVRTLYPVWEGNDVGEMLEVQERPERATFRKYRLTRNKRGEIVHHTEEVGPAGAKESVRSVTAAVRFIEHWDPVWVTYVVAGRSNRGHATGQIVKQWRHGYGAIPYFYAPGLVMNHWRSRKVGWGIGEAKRWLVEYRAFLWTLHAQIAARDTLPPLFRKKAADAPVGTKGDDKRPRRRETYKPAEIIEGGPGEELVPVQFPQVMQALKEQIALVSEAIERLESPRVKAELGGGVEGAGFAINQLLSEARIRHNPLAQSIERMMTDLTRFLWRLVRTKVKERVWVYREGEKGGWLAAGPDDLTDTVGIKWELDPERPQAKLIEGRYIHERLNAGTLGFDQAIELFGDNPDEVRIGKALDQMRQEEWYQKLLRQFILEELGRGDLLALANEAQQLAQTGVMPGMAGPPAMGNGMVPDMGNLALSPNGAGAAPVQPSPANVPGMSPTPAGAGPGVVVPTAGAGAGIQRIG